MSSPDPPVDEEDIDTTKEDPRLPQDPAEESKREFPDPFYDPKDPTKLLSDPVVHPDGESYEKLTVENDSVEYYPNRALKAIIEREVELASGSFRGRVMKLTESIRSAATRVGEATVFDIQHQPLSDSFYCPITTELISDPVITKEGYTYERSAIVQWIKTKHVSPLTRNQLLLSDVRDNNALYDLIELEQGRTDDSLHPSIRRWKNSGAALHRPTSSERLEMQAEEAEDTVDDVPTAPTAEEQRIVDQAETARCKIRCSAIIFTLFILFVAPPALVAVAFYAALVIVGISCIVGCCQCDDDDDEE